MLSTALGEARGVSDSYLLQFTSLILRFRHFCADFNQNIAELNSNYFTMLRGYIQQFGHYTIAAKSARSKAPL